MPVTFPQGVMLARSAERLPSVRALRGGCVYEPKWDGYRALVFVTEVGARHQGQIACDICGEGGHWLSKAFEDALEDSNHAGF